MHVQIADWLHNARIKSVQVHDSELIITVLKNRKTRTLVINAAPGTILYYAELVKRVVVTHETERQAL